jgi:hypothetical protein
MTANLIAGIIFGSIGFAAFVYGKKTMRYKVMTIGLLLMGFQFVVSDNTWTYIVGTALTAALYFFRE